MVRILDYEVGKLFREFCILDVKEWWRRWNREHTVYVDLLNYNKQMITVIQVETQKGGLLW